MFTKNQEVPVNSRYHWYVVIHARAQLSDNLFEANERVYKK